MKLALKRIIFTFSVCLFCFFVYWFCMRGSREERFLSWVRSEGEFKSRVEEQSGKIPYGPDQMAAFRDYFSEFQSKVSELSEDPKRASRFRMFLRKLDLDAFCSSVLLPKSRWQFISNHCRRSGFFLCPESARDYTELVQSLRGCMGSDQQKRFDQSAACSAAL